MYCVVVDEVQKFKVMGRGSVFCMEEEMFVNVIGG